ncbi:MAG TPA: sulfotransferase [Candidatus Limnocylindrales bacterium]|jgi:hypothetical protein
MAEPDAIAPPPTTGALARVKQRLRDSPAIDAWRFATSLVAAARRRSDLRGAEGYCLFIGHGRSGHSIVGSLLDAHPEAVVSDELDAVRYVALGFRRDQVLALSLDKSERLARGLRRKAGRGGTTYSYLVPGWANGRYDRLRVVGDSAAGTTVHRMHANPELLDRIDRRMARLRVRYIHVARNPFDNISTMTIRRGRDLDDAIRAYFADCDALVEIRRRIGHDRLHDLRHEDLIADPRGRLAELCRFVGLEAPGEYLEACAGILFASPSRSRDSVAWSPDRKERVEREIGRFDFLAGYSFDA